MTKQALLSCKNDNNILWSKYLVVLFVLFSLVVGLRWDVGRDYMAYYDILNGTADEWSIDRLELLNHYTIFFITECGLPYYVWFVLMAFLQLFFVSKAVVIINKHLLPFCLFCFIAFDLGFDMNVVRQGTALSIMLYAYTFISRKKILQYLALTILAFLFHRTAIIGVPFFFLYKFERIPSLKVQIPIFLTLLIFGSSVVDFLISETGSYWDILRYGQKVDQLYEHEWEIKSGLGLGVLFTNVRRLFIIFFSIKMFEVYKDKMFVIFYILFFIGASMYSATMNDMLLERVCRYLSFTDIVISSYFFYYILHYEKKYSFIAYMFIMGIIAITSYEAITSPDWHFVPNL